MKYSDALDVVLNMPEVDGFHYWGRNDSYLCIEFENEFLFNADSEGTDRETWDDIKRCLYCHLARERKQCQRAEFVLMTMLQFESKGSGLED